MCCVADVSNRILDSGVGGNHMSAYSPVVNRQKSHCGVQQVKWLDSLRFKGDHDTGAACSTAEQFLDDEEALSSAMFYVELVCRSSDGIAPRRLGALGRGRDRKTCLYRLVQSTQCISWTPVPASSLRERNMHL